MANVIIIRKHVTGNVTLGYYLVDLLCLGVKDTFYHFNISEPEAEERLEGIMDLLEECDYDLAHNIIYAAHDFAMEFDIPPHKDFKLTKFILKEDDDNVPLIDIHTGAPDGKPHLMINPQGQGKWALEKLIKNAGEGNYYYTDEDDMDEEEDYEGYNQTESLDDYPAGTITAYSAKFIKSEDLADANKLEKRNSNELLSLMIEAAIRTFELDENIVTGIDFMKTAEFELVDNCDDQINSKNGLIDLDDLDEDGFISQQLEELSKTNEIEFANKAGKIMAEHGTNLYALFKLYQYVLLAENEELLNKLCNNIYNLATNYPLAKLILAFNSVYFNLPDIRFAGILYSDKIQINFPEYHDFGADELQVYWLAKTLKSIANDDLEDSIFYYKLAVETCVENVFLWATQEKLTLYYKDKMELYN